jgi:hypothetical protein
MHGRVQVFSNRIRYLGNIAGHLGTNPLNFVGSPKWGAGHHAFVYVEIFGELVGDPGIEPGVRLREGVTVPCHTLRPVAH